ncbi:conserved hypothetical protein [Oceanicaulis sp. 350]|nr:conserved hypothetical protein [Oceanicaulis sp. 350]
MSDDTNKTPERKGPADTVRDGRIKATMWERNGESGPPYGTTITRTYTDKDGKARDTPFLSGADLLRASRVAEKAYERDERKTAHRSSRQRGTRRPRNRTRG